MGAKVDGMGRCPEGAVTYQPRAQRRPENLKNLDFGNDRLVSFLAGTKFHDSNNNAARDDREPGLPVDLNRLTITIRRRIDSNSPSHQDT